MRRFILELRRRAVFRTAGIYIGACWISIEVANVLLPAFSAPDWILRALIIAAIVGVPIVGVLAWLFEITDHGIEREHAGAEQPVPGIGGRRADFVVIGLLAFALSISVYFNVRSDRRASAPLEPISVLVADFANDTGETIFDGVLEQALTISLENAPHIALIDRRQAAEAARSLEPGVSGLPASIAPLIAIRTGAGALLSGSIRREGGSYHLSLTGTDPERDERDFSFEAEASGRDSVLATVSELAVAVREELGDPTLRERDPATGSRTQRDAYAAVSIDAAKARVLADELALAGEYSKASTQYAEAVRLDPDIPGVYMSWAIAEYQAGQRDEAARLFQIALTKIDLMSDRARLHDLGVYYLLTGDYQKALDNYAELDEHFAANTTGARNNYAVAAFGTLNFELATQIGRGLVADFPDEPLYRANLALYAMYAGDFETAAAEARATIEQDEKFGLAYLPLAISRLDAGDPQGARQTYQNMASAERYDLGGIQALVGFADVSVYEGRFGEARNTLLTSFDDDRFADNPFADAIRHVVIAESWLFGGDNAAAMIQAQRALESSDDPSILTAAAIVLIEAGNPAAAQNPTLQLESAVQANQRAYGMMLRGKLLRNESRNLEAIDTLRNALSVADLWRIRLELGKAYLDSRYYAQAYDEFRRCIERRGEASALFLDDMPSFRHLAELHYWAGLAQSGLEMRDAAISGIEAFLDLRPEGGRYVADALAFVEALRSDAQTTALPIAGQ